MIIHLMTQLYPKTKSIREEIR